MGAYFSKANFAGCIFGGNLMKLNERVEEGVINKHGRGGAGE